MSLIFTDDVPTCLGNCQQGRRACTLPGVCRASRKVTEADLDAREHERQHERARARRAATPLPPGAPEPIDWPSFKPLLIVLLTLAAVAVVSAVGAISSVTRLGS